MTIPLFSEFQNISPSYAIDYILMVFFSSIGIIQLAAISSQLTGIILIRNLNLAKSIAVLLVISPVLWFFAKTNRNINDYAGGLDSNIQALLFFLGALTGWILTTILSFIINIHMKRKDLSPFEGLDSLKKTNYFNALIFNLKYWWSNWHLRMKHYLLR